jgi:hypothetical protein
MPLVFDPEAHAFTYDGRPVPNVTRILSPLYDFNHGFQSNYVEAARRRGSAVHEATERSDKGMKWKKVETADDGIWRPTNALDAYLAAWEQFLADTNFDMHTIEETVYSQKYRYAGILDRTGILNGKRCVIDIKTTAAISPEMGIQLAAYQFAVNEGKPRTEQYPKRFICQLKPNGTYRLEEFKDRGDFGVFVALITLNNWKETHGKR